MKIIEPSVTLLHVTPNAEKVIELAGRLCYKSEDRITEDSHVAFIQMLKGNNHNSVLEHASAGFHIVTERGISHEIVRHRIASYSQESTRYANYSKDKFGGEIAVVMPSQLSGGSAAVWHSAMERAEASYMALLADGNKAQTARAVLPTCLKTELVMSANFREWIHFLKLRLSTAAHPDMRVIARLLRDELVKIAPTVFADFAEDSNG